MCSASWSRRRVAARQAVVRLSDAPQLARASGPDRAGVAFLCFPESVCRHGRRRISWPPTRAPWAAACCCGRASGNAFDWRLAYDVVPKAAGAASWARLWGRAWERRQALDVPFKQTLDLAKPELDRLALPPGLVRPCPARRSAPPGADFELLGLGKKGKGADGASAFAEMRGQRPRPRREGP